MLNKMHPADEYTNKNVNQFIYAKEKEECLAKDYESKAERCIPQSEIENDGKILFEEGRKAYFDEYFYGIKSEPKDSPSYINGIKAAERAIKFNITEAIPEKYLKENSANKKR